MPAKLGIVAGGGELPRRLIEAGRASGRELFVLALKGHAEPGQFEDVAHAWVRMGAVGQALELLKKAGVEDLVLAGRVARPSLASLRPDLRGAKVLAKVTAAALGDDGLLRAVIRELEGEGFRVIGVDDVMADLLAPQGVLGRHGPDSQAEIDIRRGLEVCLALGALDVGQAVVVQQGIVLGVEAVEGTDRLLERCGGLRRPGPGGVLVKLAKPGQERRADLPTLGPETVARAAAAGLAGIAFHAGHALILSRSAVIAAADEAGLFLKGLRLDD